MIAKFFMFIVLFVIGDVSIADEVDSHIFGKWTRTENCDEEYFVFAQNRILVHGDVDGEKTETIYNKPSYKFGKNYVVVNFGKQHGLGGVSSDKKLRINFEKDYVWIDMTKNRKIILLPCLSKHGVVK